MGKRVSIYLNDLQEPKYTRIQEIAESIGRTPIDYLLRQEEEFARVKEMTKQEKREDREGFKAYTLYLGKESIYEQTWISFYGKCLYEGENSIDHNCIQIYQGIEGKYLILYSLSDVEVIYEIKDQVEDAINLISDMSLKLLENGEMFTEEKMEELQKEYEDMAIEAYEKIGLPAKGRNILNITF